MPKPPVVNSSPLIVLARAGMIDLLQVTGDRILVPRAVVAEVTRRGPDDATVRAIAEADWLTTIDIPPTPSLVSDLRLAAGGTAVIAWALAHPETEAIIDDRTARRHALALGIPVIGTLGLILGAKHRRLIEAAGPAIERARQAGLYVSDRLVRESLLLLGE